MGDMDAEVVDDGSEETSRELRNGLLRLCAKVIHVSEVELLSREDWRIEFDLAEGKTFDDKHWFALLGYDLMRLHSIALVISPIGAANPPKWQRVGWFCAKIGHDAKQPWKSLWNEGNVSSQVLLFK
jgi:hypothetical protein